MEQIYEIVFDATKLNTYQRGRISGMIYILTRKPDKSFAWKGRLKPKRWSVFTVCTDEQYKEIVSTIEHVYPGVIIRDEG